MKVTRFNPTNVSRLVDLNRRTRYPLSGLPAFEQIFEHLPAFFSTNPVGRIAADIYEDKDHYYADFEVPGVKKEDVALELNNQLLSVTVVRREAYSDGGQSHSLTRSVSVPHTVKDEAISAKLENGILHVTLPKLEDSKPRTIEIA
ncbi:MAG: Hsp20/alpha crystallin family protein [Verrucomicrobiota bacterium]